MPNISLEGDVGNSGAFPTLLSSSLSTLKLNQEGVIKRILVHVDDYAMMREIADTTLRSGGC